MSLPPAGAMHQDPREIWHAVQGHLHEIVNLARELERHGEGIHRARARRLRDLAEELVGYLKPP